MLPDNFQPYLLAKPTGGGALDLVTSGSVYALTAGQFGFFNCPIETGVEGTTISTGQVGSVIMATGSWHTVDKIAPLYGGLQEADRTQIIDWSKVTAFMKTIAQTAQNQIVSFGWDQTSGSTTGPAFYCGTTYNFAIEAQGSPALAFLNHQLYMQLAAFSGCCGTDCSSGCTSTYADAACVMLQWKDALTQNPYWPSFVAPAVYIQTSGLTKLEVYSTYDVQRATVGTYGVALGSIMIPDPALQATVLAAGAYTCNTSNPISVVASFQLTVAYSDTRFGTCTFSPSDKFEIEPLFIQGSLVTQNADPCAVNTTINTSVPNMFTELQAGRQVRGLGQQVARNLLAWANYKQEYFPTGMETILLRMREVENFTQLTDVSLSGLYDVLQLRFKKTRDYNPSSSSDLDEYAVTIYVPTGTSTTAFTNLVSACLTAANSRVTFRTL